MPEILNQAMIENIFQKNKLLTISVILLIVIFTIVVIRNAWMSDDGYITFRTVDNFVNGYGLTWNISERVETYSNPLWMFLVSIIYFFTNEIYYSVIILSITISVLAITIFSFKISKTLVGALLGIGIFIFSKAFIDYSTSGLENPLTHLTLAIFLFVYIKAKNNFNFKILFWLSLIAALGTVNRLDILLFFIPTLAYVFFKLPKLKGLYTVVAGLMPLIAWKAFSIFYYGFPLPNTAYAKVLNTGIPKSDLIQQGFFYFENSIKWDPLTLLIVFAGISLPLIGKQKHLIPVIVGIILYLLYVLQTGGDFMSERYFAAPLFIAVVLISQNNFTSLKRIPLIVLAVIIILVGITAIKPPIFSDEMYEEISPIDHGIVDERGRYHDNTGLYRLGENNGTPEHYGVTEGLEAKISGDSPQVRRIIGMYGYYVGPEIHVIDPFGLGDPLISKLTPSYDPEWRIGHQTRELPPGYFETIKNGTNVIEDKNLAEYYEKIALITRGNLSDVKRLEVIWNMNIGKYDSLLCNYINSNKLPQHPSC